MRHKLFAITATVAVWNWAHVMFAEPLLCVVGMVAVVTCEAKTELIAEMAGSSIARSIQVAHHAWHRGSESE